MIDTLRGEHAGRSYPQMTSRLQDLQNYATTPTRPDPPTLLGNIMELEECVEALKNTIEALAGRLTQPDPDSRPDSPYVPTPAGRLLQLIGRVNSARLRIEELIREVG